MHFRINITALDLSKKMFLYVVVGFFFTISAQSCKFLFTEDEQEKDSNTENSAANASSSNVKTGGGDCIDPDLSKLSAGVQVTLCDGTLGVGTLLIDAADILLGVSYGGIEGELVAVTGDCNASTFSNCTATNDYRATDSSVLASKVLTGQTVAGVAGTAPVAGAADPWDIRYGVSVDAVVGKLKVNCRNLVNTATFGSVDADSTIDDWNDPNSALPSQNPWTDENFCGFNLPVDATFERVVTTPATSSSQSVFRDRVSGQRWTRGTSLTTYTWANALTYCATTMNAENSGAGHGGILGWRLPTLKEMNQAYLNGMFDLDNTLTSTDNLAEMETTFWSSTTDSTNTANAFRINMSSAFTNSDVKSGSSRVLCVSDP